MKDQIKHWIASGAIEAIESDNSASIAALEIAAGLRFPPLFRSLLTSYLFEPFALGGVEFFGNASAGEAGDISVEPFKDSVLSPALLQAGLLQVGRPEGGSYDPVCFNLGSKAREPELVLVNHESILSFGKLKIAGVIAPSFPALLAAMLANKSFKRTPNGAA
jgi:hypothetical protein